MDAVPSTPEPATAAAIIAEICGALRRAGLAEGKQPLTGADAPRGARALDVRLEQIQAALDRIEARLGEVEHELAVLTRPSWPF